MIGVVTAGRIELAIDFEVLSLSAGEAVVITPGQVHSSGDYADGEGFVLAMSPDMLTEGDVARVREYSLSREPIHLGDDDLEDIVGLYEVMRRRAGRHGDAETALASAVKSIVIGNIIVSVDAAPGRYSRLVVRLQSLMEEHIEMVKSPSAYASMLNVSGVYLNEAVKAVTGKSAGGFIGDYVVTLAKRELCHTARTAQEIAAALGFEDYGYFSRMFKRHSGVSPSEFRRKYLG